MTAGKWRKRYEDQVLANNILSDRIRQIRAGTTRSIDFARNTIVAAQVRISELEAKIEELTPKEGNEDS